jgi:Spy/CpxP family protein refolding chaperone
MGRLLACVCALTLGLPGAVAVRAQVPEEAEHPARPEWMREPLNRFGIVLGHRTDLGLTPDQAAQLEALRSTLAERNKPLEDEARNIIGRTRAGAENGNVVERDVARANFERVRKVRDQVQKNDKEAWKEGERLLTKEQKKKADKLISQREAELKGEVPPFRGRRGGPMSGRRPTGSPQ